MNRLEKQSSRRDASFFAVVSVFVGLGSAVFCCSLPVACSSGFCDSVWNKSTTLSVVSVVSKLLMLSISMFVGFFPFLLFLCHVSCVMSL